VSCIINIFLFFYVFFFKYRMSHSLPNLAFFLIIVTPMKILQWNLNRSTFVVWEMKRNVSVACFKFQCTILINGKIIKEMPGLVASGTHSTVPISICTCRRVLVHSCWNYNRKHSSVSTDNWTMFIWHLYWGMTSGMKFWNIDLYSQYYKPNWLLL